MDLDFIQEAKNRADKKLMDALEKKFAERASESIETDTQPPSATQQIADGIRSGGLDTSEADAEFLEEVGKQIKKNQELKQQAEIIKQSGVK